MKRQQTIRIIMVWTMLGGIFNFASVFGGICNTTEDDCPPIMTVRIQDFGETGKPALFLSDNEGTPEWSATADNNSVWYEIPAEGSTVDFYYKNVGTGKYLYRESTGKQSTACDWQPENALLDDTNPKTDFYKFRKTSSTWGGRVWLVNVAAADFNNIAAKGAFIISGINKNHTSCGMPDYPAVVMTAIPNNSNVWSSVTIEMVSANVTDPDCQSICDISIIAHPQTISYIAGGSATPLSVTANGENLTYRWFKSIDNSNKTPENDVLISQTENFTPDISVRNRSYYYVKLSNQNCERASNVAIVTVNSDPTVDFPNYPEGYPITMQMTNPLFWQFGSEMVNAAGELIPGARGNLYTADCSAHVWDIDGTPTLFAYASHDLEQSNGCDRMDRYHVFSTADMLNWTDHGEIFKAADVPWHNGIFRNNSTFMWAPDCVYKNGKYYYYFPHPSQNANDQTGSWGNNWQTGIAVSDHPATDFTILPQPLKGLNNGAEHHIDPCVFIDDDGQAYFYNGGGGRCFGGKLKDNMIEIDGDMQTMTGLVNFHEATWVHKYNGKYYLSHSDNGGGGSGNGDHLKYAVSDNPLGPWTDMGVYLYATGCGTNHGSIVEFNGQWYAFYHTDYVSYKGELRSVHFDKLYYNSDGSIKIVNTFGTPYKDLTRTVKDTDNSTDIALVLQAEDFNDGGETYGYFDKNKTPKDVYRPTIGMSIEARASGYNLGDLENREFTRYTIFVEKAGFYDIDCYVASQNNNGRFYLNVNGENKSGTVNVSGNGGWGDNGFAKLSVKNIPFGAGENLFEMRIENGGFNIDRFEFRKAQPYAGTPFKENIVPGKIEAEDFDAGGLAVAYYSTTTDNKGGNNYRSGDDGKSANLEGSGGRINISHSSTGEWFKYTLDVHKSGIYDVTAYVASGNGTNGSIFLSFDDLREYPISVTTANWSTYAEVTLHDITLMKGKNVMTMTIGGNINIDWYRFDLIEEIIEPISAAPTESNKKNITPYPNPTTGIVYFNTQTDTRIYNAQGVMLKRVFASQIDLSDFPAGMYILLINNDEWKKIVKN